MSVERRDNYWLSEFETQPPARDPFMAFALRWWWLLLIGAILGSVGAFAYLKYGPKSYETAALVQVLPPSNSDPTQDNREGARAVSGYAAEASSSRMFELVSAALGAKVGVSASKLSTMMDDGLIEIKSVKNSNLVSIAVSDPDPQRAELLANTIAAVFVKDVNARAVARLQARMKQLDQQIQTTRDRLTTAQLQGREDSLKEDLADQRTLLLQLQLSYQQELQNQANLARIASEAEKPSAPQPQLGQLQSEWQRIVNEQIKDVQGNISDLNTELADVRKRLAQLPSSADPTVSSALAGAYGDQLQALTQEFAKLQLNGQETTTPLVRYGEASDPVSASSGKKTLLLGFAAGVALFGGLGYAFDLLGRIRRSRRSKLAASDQVSMPEQVSVPDLMERLDRLGITDEAVAERRASSKLWEREG